MDNGNFKIVTVIIVLGITLGLLLGLQKYYNNNYVEGPVKNSLERLTFVDSVDIKQKNGIYDYRVKIKKAGNVQYEFLKVDEIISDNLKGKEYTLTLVDRRNQKLNQDLDTLELNVYEAMAKNNYLWLDETFRETARKNGFSYKLFIDDKRLYIQLSEKNAFLYEIIERSTPQNGGLDKGE